MLEIPQSVSDLLEKYPVALKNWNEYREWSISERIPVSETSAIAYIFIQLGCLLREDTNDN